MSLDPLFPPPILNRLTWSLLKREQSTIGPLYLMTSAELSLVGRALVVPEGRQRLSSPTLRHQLELALLEKQLDSPRFWGEKWQMVG